MDTLTSLSPSDIDYTVNHGSNELDNARRTGKLFAYAVYRQDKPSIGERLAYFANRQHAPTITGIQLYHGQHISVGPVTCSRRWTSNLGDRRIAVRCALPTGAMGALETWHGTVFDDYGYCRLTRDKRQAAT